MSDTISITAGSVGRAWAVKMLDGSGAAVDLTSATAVSFSMRLRGSTTRVVDDATAVVANGTYTLPDGSSQAFTPTDGVLIYQPSGTDTDTPGTYEGQFSYTLGSGAVVDPGAGYVTINIQQAV